MEEARWLRNFVGKVGYIQLGFPCQGVIFLYEVSRTGTRPFSGWKMRPTITMAS